MRILPIIAALLILSLSALAGEYHALITRVVDGDTVEAKIVLGFKVSMTSHIRINGINAPEHGTPGGEAATEFLRKLLLDANVKVVTSERDEFDKYGRVLARLIMRDGTDVSQLMIEKGHAVSYNGGKR